MQIRSYLDALKDFEAVDIQAAIERFRHGLAPSSNHQFCPSSAQLAIEVRERKLMRELLAKRGGLSLVKA